MIKMREILFRAKHDPKYGTGWRYGVPYIDHENDCIMATYGGKSVVIADTVGQFTGLTDKNGVKIFEGDIIRHYEYDYYNGKKNKIGIVYYAGSAFCVDNGSPEDVELLGCAIDCDCEVIGNKYDNPELLDRRCEE